MAGLGLSMRAFEEEISVNRRTIQRAIEDDSAVRDTSYQLIERGLDELEQGADGRGRQLKQRRERVGLTAQTLANLSGVNRNTIAAIERGQSHRSLTMRKIESILDDMEEERGLEQLAPQDPESEPEEEDRLDVTITISINGADLRRILGRD